MVVLDEDRDRPVHVLRGPRLHREVVDSDIDQGLVVGGAADAHDLLPTIICVRYLRTGASPISMLGITSL